MSASALQAQSRTVRVVSTDSVPVVFAWVSVEGGTGQISNERGEVDLGAGKRKTISLLVRRIGYQPWFGKVELPDTAPILTVVLTPLARLLGEVHIFGAASAPPNLRQFYDRWLMRQKGLLSATFIGPEEIEFRHPNKITNMLDGLNGVSFRRTDLGDRVAYGYNGTCQMAILVDGVRACPARGCKCDGCAGNMPSIAMRDTSKLTEMTAVVIDRFLDANDVAAIEVYARGGNIPTSLHVSDPGCGAIAIWTGSRRP
jgi:hypothetical protein